MLGVNLSSGVYYNRINDSIAEAVAWVNYCKAMDYNVKYWFIGNEPYLSGDHGQSAMNSSVYANHVVSFSQAMKAAGNKVIIIMGARSKELLILEDEMRAIADELIICTDDGSAGRKGLVTEPLKELCEQDPKPAMAVAIGPPVMMKFCAATTRPYEVPTQVSLNTIMVDGTGMCGGCRVTVGNETKFVCVDGPEFDGHLVDFDNMINRLNSYKKQENEAHDCKIGLKTGENS